MVKETTPNTTPSDFESVLDNNEKVIWTDKPVFAPYVLTVAWHHFFIIIFLGFFMVQFYKGGGAVNGNTPYVLMLAAVFLVDLYLLLSGFFNYSNLVYAYSNR